MKVSLGKKNVVKFGDLNSGDCFVTENGFVYMKCTNNNFDNDQREFFGVHLDSGRKTDFRINDEVRLVDLECVEV